MTNAVSEETINDLRTMARQIEDADDWWRFPNEPIVQGFMGTGPFVVGDQPSTSDWDESNRNRRVFYDLLAQVMPNAHLTDIYKKRGRSGSLRAGLPQDFQEHVQFFRTELALLKPNRVVALGHLSYRLLKRHVPEVRPILGRMWHFAYVVRYNKTALYESNMRSAFQHWNSE
jgi:hypothetical protein